MSKLLGGYTLCQSDNNFSVFDHYECDGQMDLFECFAEFATEGKKNIVVASEINSEKESA